MPCLEPTQLRNDMNPVVLNRVMAACIAQTQLDNAVFAFALSGAYGHFDSLRVADKTAHQVVKVIRGFTLQSADSAQLQAFQSHLTATMGNPAQRRGLCASVRSFGPPAYFPAYMVQHGMAAMSAATAGSTPAPRALVDNFDEARGWTAAVTSYLQCEGA
ncbi:hypothetical protein CUPL110328_23250 [Cupriavidus plantarum]|uniref:Uncharacterized protein n=1 Tax=Cupriavidus plantarum TaxID=942865 RepID=A0A316F0P5_9BURK|nr:hypothetical protein C7419_1011031 [Cupriavidus plantarum]RLK45040.1 hypothetical protein C7417_1046 [Cupriavidus plantarum]CAG2129911.1 hypothetical protein LMG26296_01633 [Cupriavidus plantarum]SMR66232.1 hypothetical protein SAMN05421735_1112 [Cupriavidus plantarum]